VSPRQAAAVGIAVPELAPSLGRLIVPRPAAHPWVPLDDVRATLATDVMMLAGAARRADDAGAAAAALAPAWWQAAWERAVRRAAERVAAAIDGAIAHAAWRVRMPARQRRRHALTAAEQRAVAVRFALCGEPLGVALPALAAAGERYAAAPDDPAAAADWRDAVRLCARRLEASWLALEAAAEDERGRWRPEIEDVGAWRPPLWPVVLGWVPVAAVLLWLGLVLGGYLPAPAWLAARLGF
jgi:hypothetical protein